jgi:PLP dependent protein
MTIRDNIRSLRQTLPVDVRLIAISKNQDISKITEAYDAGQRSFGENKVQELTTKFPLLPKDIDWHFVGHLQTNKVKLIAPFISMIHSIDSLKLLEEVNKEALRNHRIVDCLLQFHIAREETKFGLSFTEAINILESSAFKEMQNVKLCGVMGMASFINDMNAVRQEFMDMHSIYTRLKERFFADQICFKEISMGMSQDYQVAIKEGSTMIRIGTGIFG